MLLDFVPQAFTFVSVLLALALGGVGVRALYLNRAAITERVGRIRLRRAKRQKPDPFYLSLALTVSNGQAIGSVAAVQTVFPESEECPRCDGEDQPWGVAPARKLLENPKKLAAVLAEGKICLDCLRRLVTAQRTLARVEGSSPQKTASPAPSSPDPAPPPAQPEKSSGSGKRIVAAVAAVPMLGMAFQFASIGFMGALFLEGSGFFGDLVSAAAFTVSIVFFLIGILLARTAVKG